MVCTGIMQDVYY